MTVSNLVETSDGTKLGWAVPGVVVSAGQQVEVALDSSHLTLAVDETGPLRIAQPVSLGFTDPPLLFDTATRRPIGRLIPGNWTGNRSA